MQSIESIDRKIKLQNLISASTLQDGKHKKIHSSLESDLMSYVEYFFKYTSLVAGLL